VNVMTLTGLGGAGLGTNAFLGFQAGGAEIDSLTGGAGDDLMLGLGGNDVLIAGDGDDQLFGGIGTDTMKGGEGNDVYHVDSLLDVVEDVANPISLVLPGGTGAGAAGSSNIGDTIIAAINYSLNREEVQNIEHLQLFGKAARGEGNALSNLVRGNLGNDSLTGFGGADTLDGGAGADTMVGGMGNDVYVVDSAGDKVTELGGEGTDDVLLSSVTRKLDLNVEHLVLTGRASIIGTGNKQNNSITGNIGKNLLVGDVGDDTLNGGAGADTMNGGKGNDYYVVDAGGKAADIIVNETGGNDTIESSVTRLLEASVENIILTGNRAIDATGNAGANRLIGNINDNDLSGGDGADTLVGGSGNDSLNGGTGADVDSMIGGLGNDTYVVVDNAVDQIVEAEDGGTDTVQATVTIATLAENVENIVLGRIGKVHPNINATGNGLNNTMTGNGGSNTLDGGDGNDTVDGAGGVDVLRGGAGDDVLVWDAADGSVDGGENSEEGGDVLLVLGAAQDIVLSEENIAGIEGVNLTGSGDNKLTVTSADVLAMSSTDTLLVEGNDGDEVHFDDPSGWHEGTTSVDGVSYHMFTKEGATILVSTAIDVTGLVS
jgi:Ca2+-binding RTX toxin-like protein